MDAGIEILVVEDSATQAEQLRYLLEGSGYQVRIAANGRAGLEAARTGQPALVISDIVMPELDGYDLCRALKADPQTRETPVILLTSLAEPRSIISSLECGADNFIRKPFEEKYLLSRVANIVSSLELREEGALRMGIEVFLAGERHFITSERQQILDFLISTYEEIAGFNDELQAKQRALEEREAELAEANAALAERQVELEVALEELRTEKERVDRLYGIAAALATETEPQVLAETVLSELCASQHDDAGALYASDDGEPPRLLARCGVACPELDVEVLVPAHGIAGAADTAPRRRRGSTAVGGDSTLRVPLVQGDRVLGAIVLRRGDGTEFGPAEIEGIEHLANQAAIALANAFSLRSALRLAGINQTVLDASREGIALVGLDGEFMLRNAVLRQMRRGLGLPDDLPLRGVIEALAERVTDPEALWEFMSDASGNPIFEGSIDLELPASSCVLAMTVSPVVGAGGSCVGQLYTVRDVTGEREIERLKSELVATVSHELRTPLTGIRGFAELLVKGRVDAETQSRYLAIIHGEAERLTTLVNDFLDLQRMEAGAFELAREPLDLLEILARATELFSAQSDTHEIELHVREQARTVVGDADRVAQVVANLLSNAIKYSPEGGKVEVRAERRGSAIRVAVQDEGLGIPTAQQDRLFTRFFRVDSSDTREIGGTGLGLALVREIVEAQGGRVGVDSTEGRGSTFWFELPAAA